MVAYDLNIRCDKPNSFRDVVDTKESKEWITTMENEMSSLEKNETWELLKFPNKKRAIGCKWVYTKKEGKQGSQSLIYKARLVAKEYAHNKGIDYYKVFHQLSSILQSLALTT